MVWSRLDRSSCRAHCAIAPRAGRDSPPSAKRWAKGARPSGPLVSARIARASPSARPGGPPSLSPRHRRGNRVIARELRVRECAPIRECPQFEFPPIRESAPPKFESAPQFRGPTPIASALRFSSPTRHHECARSSPERALETSAATTPPARPTPPRGPAGGRRTRWRCGRCGTSERRVSRAIPPCRADASPAASRGRGRTRCASD